jgi:hypothetical protein
MLNDFFKDTIQISRLSTVSRKKTQSVVATDVLAHIQPLQDTKNEGSIARTFNEFLMFTKTEVRIGDKLIDQNTKKYEVIGVGAMNFRVGLRHYESTLKAL